MTTFLFDHAAWIVASLGSLFFVVLTVYYSLQKRTRRFVPATFVIASGCLGSLSRILFVSYFSGAEGIWRLVNVLLLIGGAIMYQREWNRMKRGAPEG